MKKIKLDILAFGAHPDDVEAGTAGFLLKAKKHQQKVGVIDLSAGEMGKNDSDIKRKSEAQKASKILQVDTRECLGFTDSEIENSLENRIKIIEVIRKYQPTTLLVPFWEDRHPDHVATSNLISKSIFQAEMDSLETDYLFHKPTQIFYYMLQYEFEPSFILDITEEFAFKLQALAAYDSQFQNVSENLPESLQFWESRARYFGSRIGVQYGEPYKTKQVVGLKHFSSIISNNF